jgi:hypothetical protein
MKDEFSWSRYIVYLLIFLSLIGCSSTKNRTEERAKERVIQFIRLMAEDRLEEVEKLLSRDMQASEFKEIFLNNYDNWELKDTSIIITVDDISYVKRDSLNRATVTITVRNDKLDYTKMATLSIKFEKGDWYIGG